MSGRGAPAPVGLRRAGAVLLALGFALFLVARSTGAGWDVVVLCALIAVLVAGAVLPLPALSRVRLAVEVPRDATAGRPVAMELRLTGRARGLQVRVRAPEGDWSAADSPCAGETTVVPAHRGVVSEVVVDLRSSSPLGLVVWRRRVPVPLVPPLEVGPRSIAMSFRAVPGRALTRHDDVRAGADGDELVRGVRDYVDGDPIRRLHWPASASTGRLMVRELEGPRRPHVVIVVDLRGTDPERDAGRAAGLARDALRQGARVDLATIERDGPRLAAVTSSIQVGRRLARAVVGAPPAGPFPPGVQVERIGDRG